MKTACLVLLLVCGQVSDRRAAPVAENDPLYPLLAAHQAAIEAQYQEAGHSLADFGKWIYVDSPAAASLFPELVFATVSWSERPNPATKKPAARASRLAKTLAIDRRSRKIVSELMAWGDFAAFGALLVDQRIAIRDDEDAERVWNTFCELHHKGWKGYGRRQVGDGEWRLGIARSDQTIAADDDFRTVVTHTYFTRVLVDPASGRILSWQSTVESSNQRKVPLTEDAS